MQGKQNRDAVNLIRRAAAEFPRAFPSLIRDQWEATNRDAEGLPQGIVLTGILARLWALGRAEECVLAGEFEALHHDRSAGIVALECARKVLGLSRAERTAAAVNEWGN